MTDFKFLIILSKIKKKARNKYVNKISKKILTQESKQVGKILFSSFKKKLSQ